MYIIHNYYVHITQYYVPIGFVDFDALITQDNYKDSRYVKIKRNKVVVKKFLRFASEIKRKKAERLAVGTCSVVLPISGIQPAAARFCETAVSQKILDTTPHFARARRIYRFTGLREFLSLVTEDGW